MSRAALRTAGSLARSISSRLKGRLPLWRRSSMFGMSTKSRRKLPPSQSHAVVEARLPTASALMAMLVRETSTSETSGLAAMTEWKEACPPASGRCALRPPQRWLFKNDCEKRQEKEPHPRPSRCMERSCGGPVGPTMRLQGQGVRSGGLSARSSPFFCGERRICCRSVSPAERTMDRVAQCDMVNHSLTLGSPQSC